MEVRDTAPSRWLFGRYDYPVGHRLLELASITVVCWFGLPWATAVVAGVLDRLSLLTAPGMVVVLLAALAVADFASGVVHFLFDNFGSPETPVIGQKFVLPFRVHHDDPMLMTHGDFIAVNADNVFVSLPVVVLGALALDPADHGYLGLFVLGLVVAVVMTNQIHKWAHLPDVPDPVRRAQRLGLILSPTHHAVHHTAPYVANYCIAWGRLDPLLNRLVRRGLPGPG